MIPRAEIALIVASVGLTAKLIDSQLYAVIVFVVVATVLVAPALLRLAMPRGEGATA
jgi:Kef-type K+ transport system membrane component KefB